MYFVLPVLLASMATAQVEVEEYTLDNGMTFLLLPRSEQPNNVSAGWLAHVGSVEKVVDTPLQQDPRATHAPSRAATSHQRAQQHAVEIRRAAPPLAPETAE